MPLPDPVETPLMRPGDLLGLIPDKGRSAIYEAIRHGDIPSVRIGGSVYIPTGELRRLWAVDPPVESNAPPGERNGRPDREAPASKVAALDDDEIRLIR